jgi:hypothetical protein
MPRRYDGKVREPRRLVATVKMLAAGSLKERTIRRTEDRGLGAKIGVVQVDVRAFVDSHQGRCHREIGVLTGTRRRASVQRRQYREVIDRSAPPNPVGRTKIAHPPAKRLLLRREAHLHDGLLNRAPAHRSQDLDFEFILTIYLQVSELEHF